MLREAQFRGLFDPAAVRDALTRRRSRVVRELLDDLNATQSMLEDAFLRLCRSHGIPAPTARRLRAARAAPHRRAPSNAAQLAGWTILRSTWADVTRRPAHVAAQVLRALGA